MWDESECGEKRADAADILSSWALVAAILLGIAVWPVLQLLLTDATEPIPAGRDASAPSEIPPIPNAMATAAGSGSSAAQPTGDSPRR